MRQIGLALHNYESTYQVLPPSSTNDVEQGGWIVRPRRRHIHSWLSLILPQLEGANLQNKIDYRVSALDAANLPVASQILPLYRCPSYGGPNYSTSRHYTRFSDRYTIGNYVGMGSSDVGHIYGQNTGLFEPNGMLYPQSYTSFSAVVDGLSNTIMAVETRETQMAVWIDGGTAAVVALRYDPLNSPTYSGIEHALNHTPYFPYTNPSSDFGPSSRHPGGALHLLGDTSVQFVSDSIAAATYAGLATRHGREVVNGAF